MDWIGDLIEQVDKLEEEDKLIKAYRALNLLVSAMTLQQLGCGKMEDKIIYEDAFNILKEIGINTTHMPNP